MIGNQNKTKKGFPDFIQENLYLVFWFLFLSCQILELKTNN